MFERKIARRYNNTLKRSLIPKNFVSNVCFQRIELEGTETVILNLCIVIKCLRNNLVIKLNVAIGWYISFDVRFLWNFQWMMCRLSRNLGVFSSDGNLILLILLIPSNSEKNFLILKDNDSIEYSNISREIWTSWNVPFSS